VSPEWCTPPKNRWSVNKKLKLFAVITLFRCCLATQNSNSLLYFSKFLINAKFDLIANYTLMLLKEHDSVDACIVQTECYQVFWHHWNTSLHQECIEKSDANQWIPKPLIPFLSFPIGKLDPPSNTLFLRPIRPIAANGISIDAAVFSAICRYQRTERTDRPTKQTWNSTCTNKPPTLSATRPNNNISVVSYGPMIWSLSIIL